MQKLTGAVALLGAAMGICVAATAAAQEARTIVVRSADLNIRDAAGQRLMQRRVHWAIDSACRQDSMELAARRIERLCKASMNADAAPKVAALLRAADAPVALANLMPR